MDNTSNSFMFEMINVLHYVVLDDQSFFIIKSMYSCVNLSKI